MNIIRKSRSGAHKKLKFVFNNLIKRKPQMLSIIYYMTIDMQTRFKCRIWRFPCLPTAPSTKSNQTALSNGIISYGLPTPTYRKLCLHLFWSYCYILGGFIFPVYFFDFMLRKWVVFKVFFSISSHSWILLLCLNYFPYFVSAIASVFNFYYYLFIHGVSFSVGFYSITI